MGLTVRDLANICGVNASTVSRALRDDPRITAATREKVRQAAAAHGYMPNLTARNLAAGKTNSVWFFLGALENEIEKTPATYLSRIMLDAGYDLLLVIHNNDNETLQRLLHKLSQKVADAAIIIPPSGHEDWGEGLPSEGSMPILFLDRWLTGRNIPVVTTANASASRQLAEMCYENGARFFVVLYDDDNPVSGTRRQAACDWLKEHHLPYCTKADLTPELLLEHAGQPVAVLGNSGLYVMDVMRQKMGSELDHLQVIGGFFDFWNNPNKEFFFKIFICHQDYRGLAEQCAKVMLAWLENHKAPRHKFFEVQPSGFSEI